MAIAPRAESVLDQREITIQSYQTTIPFDPTAIKDGLDRAWLTPAIRFGVFSCGCDMIEKSDHAVVVLGLQDELSIRAYDYDARRPLWYSWQNIIVDTVSVRYSKDDTGMIRFTTTGGGRRITDDLLNDFNSTFIGIPRESVTKLQFDLAKLRELCFGRFIDNLYMVKFSGPSGEEYRSIDHALFKSRLYIHPDAERLKEVRADGQVKIESFDSDIIVWPDALADSAQVRFDIRGTRGLLRLRFPKLIYKTQSTTPEEQAKVFYDIVDATVKSILDANYYTEHLHSLADLNSNADVFPDLVDLSPYREVLLKTKYMQEFFNGLDLGMPRNKWQPHLRAIDELLLSENVAEDVKTLIAVLSKRDPLLVARLLAECQEDIKMCRVGHIVAEMIAKQLQVFPADIRPHVEEAVLSWTIAKETSTWDVNPDSGAISVLNILWQISDLSVEIQPLVLWKLIGVFHDRLINKNSDPGALLRRFNWCMTNVKSLPANLSNLQPAFRLVVEQKVPTSLADGASVLKEQVADIPALDDAVLNQFGLPLWPFLVASREDGKVILRNTGIGIAIAVRAIPTETLFSDDTSAVCDIRPDESIILPISSKQTKLDIQFSKFGKKYRFKLQLEESDTTKTEVQSTHKNVEHFVLADPELTVLVDLQSNKGMSRNRKTIAFATGISDGAMKTILRRFEDLELIDRPQGERMGYAITPEGISLYNKLFLTPPK